MKYELTIKLLVQTPADEDRVAHLVELLVDFGTVEEPFAEGPRLAEDPLPAWLFQ
jgi:hypothetical protein